MPIALFALAVGAFGIGLTEFVIVGILPQIAAEFSVSIPKAGMMATSYALGVFIGAPLLTIIGARPPRKAMLITLAGIFTVGNIITAIAPTMAIAIVAVLSPHLITGPFLVSARLLPHRWWRQDARQAPLPLCFRG